MPIPCGRAQVPSHNGVHACSFQCIPVYRQVHLPGINKPFFRQGVQCQYRNPVATGRGRLHRTGSQRHEPRIHIRRQLIDNCLRITGDGNDRRRISGQAIT